MVLRAHLAGQNETVIACDGIPQRRETGLDTLKFLLRRRVVVGPDDSVALHG